MHVYCLGGEFRGGDRYARHWYDLDCLDQIAVSDRALEDRDLALEVAAHKQMFFTEKAKCAFRGHPPGDSDLIRESPIPI